MALRQEPLADNHPDPLPKPELLRAREGDRHDRDLRLDRKMGESLLEGQELAFLGAVVALGEDGDGAPQLEASVDVVEEGLVAMALANDGYVTARGADDPPLELAGHEDRGVGQEMESRFNRKEQQDGEFVQPVQVVADDDVVAGSFGDIFAAFHLEAKAEPQEGTSDQPDCAIREVGLASDRQEVGWRKSGAGHLDGRQSKR